MKRVVVAVGLALMMGGCGARQSPAPPQVKVAVEAPGRKPEAPPPPTGAEILAAEPSQVRDAIKDTRKVASGRSTARRAP